MEHALMNRAPELGSTKVWDDKGLQFEVQLVDRSVTCWVSRAALETLSRRPLDGRADVRQVFDKHSPQIVRIAAFKAEAWIATQKQGFPLPMRLDASDFA